MKGKILTRFALLLWVATVIVAGVIFVNGNTIHLKDDRDVILLQENERAFVLAEMRKLLEGVQGIMAGLVADDQDLIARSSRSVGMAAAADTSPNLMMKLPLAFKQQGINLHKQFDIIADEAEAGVAPYKIMAMLSEQLSSCVACHASYRINAVADM